MHSNTVLCIKDYIQHSNWIENKEFNLFESTIFKRLKTNIGNGNIFSITQKKKNCYFKNPLYNEILSSKQEQKIVKLFVVYTYLLV